MIEVRRGAGRERSEPGEGISTRHAFSFGGHYDPGNTRFALLLACNEERLEPGAGFGEHPHRDTEILTWVVEGELEHRDAAGNASRLGPGGFQRLSAGSGVRHVERNAGATPLRFLQMWLHPDTFGGPPEYIGVSDTHGPGLRVLTSGERGLRQRAAALHVGRTMRAESVPLPAAPYRYVHVVHGTVRLDGEELSAGDAARITGGEELAAQSGGAAEFLVWEMHAEPSYG
ncbi:pirin family protein [Actinacidiphila alni]|uniref:pirin family protein n=1 Tax=Actinacidiphila alni TaxID=380248 RepID=UPI0033FC9F7C